ncbi:putative RNA polymerase 18 kDa subunit [Yalta virus]|nr:putative RNA polymerase 18 kDa subunit [Yalta virus]
MEKTIHINGVNESMSRELNKILSKAKNEDKIDITLNLDIYIPSTMFDVNFRSELINFIKKHYESRAYYMFYIEQVDYNPIIDNELPLVKLQGERYVMNIPLDVKILYFKKNDTVSLKLILDNNIAENKINVFGENTYISCKINLNNNQIIEAGHQRVEAIKDNTYNKVYKKGDRIQVKITSFFNNQLHNGFSPRINCEGILI